MGVGGQCHAPVTLPPGKTQYPLHRRLGGPQCRSGLAWKISPPTGIWSPNRPARRELLYRLSYPGSLSKPQYRTKLLHFHPHTTTVVHEIYDTYREAKLHSQGWWLHGMCAEETNLTFTSLHTWTLRTTGMSSRKMWNEQMRTITKS